MKDDSRLFQQVSPHVGSDDLERGVEVDLDVLAEPRGVVVPSGFRISDGLHDRGRSQDSLLDLSLGLRGAADRRKVPHGVLRAHRLAGAGFAGHDDRLVAVVSGKEQLTFLLRSTH